MIFFAAGTLFALYPLPVDAADPPSFLIPSRVEVSLNGGWDSNLLNSSDNELEAFDTRDPDVFFVVDRTEDAFFLGEIQAEWILGRPLGVKTKVRTGYRRLQYINAQIKNEDNYELDLLFRPAHKTRVALKFEHIPQIYGRHRRDKDAAPGEPLFRAEVHKRWELGLEVKQTLHPHWQVMAEVADTWRDYTDAFNERDRNRVEVAAGVEWLPESWFELGLEAGFRRLKSRNKPDLGRDLSYREILLEPNVRLKERKWMPQLDVSVELKLRDYTSGRPEDKRHYERKDLFGEVRAKATRSLTKRFAVTVTGKYTWKNAEFDPKFDVDFDGEEGSFSEFVVMGGITWRWEAE